MRSILLCEKSNGLALAERKAVFITPFFLRQATLGLSFKQWHPLAYPHIHEFVIHKRLLSGDISDTTISEKGL